MKSVKLALLMALAAVLMTPPGVLAQAKSMKAPAMHGDGAAMLKQDMRKLWTDHVVWTRDYIVAAVGDQPDAKAAADRLMKNQEDIGNAVAKFYGASAGQQLFRLDANPYFHRGPTDVIDARLHDDQVAEVNRLAKVDAVDRCRDHGRSRVSKRGDRSALVHQGKNHAAEDVTKVVRMSGHHELGRFVLAVADALGRGGTHGECRSG